MPSDTPRHLRIARLAGRDIYMARRHCLDALLGKPAFAGTRAPQYQRHRRKIALGVHLVTF
jgi:hypothetical protein